MYCPQHFSEQRIEALHGLMREHALASVVIASPEGLTADHIPLVLHEDIGAKGVLRGHVARANPLWRHAREPQHVLAIFQSVEAYMSPNWYATKRETGKVVPTWNYAVVHARGRMRAIDDPDWVRQQIQTLTTIHESQFEAPWAVSDAPADYVDGMLGAIVGIEIEIESLIGKWKVSQNQPERNRETAIEGLQTHGDIEMASLVKHFGPS